MAITTGKAILKESRVIGSVAGFTHATRVVCLQVRRHDVVLGSQ
jgi:hypothetical protein